MENAQTALTQTPWARMQSFSRFRLFGVETPVIFDYIALAAIVVVTDAMTSWPGWSEALLTGFIWALSTTATSYFRAKAELQTERLAEWQARKLPPMR